MFGCGVQVTLNFIAMSQKPICVLEEAWESVISLPSEVVSGSLLRLLKFLPVFKLAVRFAAGSALMRNGVFPENGRDRCGPSSSLAMSSWLSGMERNFAEKRD